CGCAQQSRRRLSEAAGSPCLGIRRKSVQACTGESRHTGYAWMDMGRTRQRRERITVPGKGRNPGPWSRGYSLSSRGGPGQIGRQDQGQKGTGTAVEYGKAFLQHRRCKNSIETIAVMMVVFSVNDL